MGNRTIEEIMDEYGYIDEEIGRIPGTSDEMTEEERKMVEEYIAELIREYEDMEFGIVD